MKYFKHILIILLILIVILLATIIFVLNTKKASDTDNKDNINTTSTPTQDNINNEINATKLTNKTEKFYLGWWKSGNNVIKIEKINDVIILNSYWSNFYLNYYKDKNLIKKSGEFISTSNSIFGKFLSKDSTYYSISKIKNGINVKFKDIDMIGITKDTDYETILLKNFDTKQTLYFTNKDENNPFKINELKTKFIDGYLCNKNKIIIKPKDESIFIDKQNFEFEKIQEYK